MADPAAGPLPVLAGRYRALARLGAGGMGVVWRARDELLHREVAIKEVTLAPHLPQEHRDEMRERTMREARAAARLGHPSIVAVHDVIAQDGRPWIVMDLVRGRSLDDAIRADGPLPPHRVAVIGLAVLDALTLAHSRGIMHRDVKPANIMLAQDGGVLLTDFGIATVEGDAQLTSPDALVGSPGYIAPERLRGTGDGPSADLWSLGATLYAAVEGQGPFRRDTPVATIGAVLTQETPFPSRARELAPVLLAMLAKDPRQRPGESGLRAALRQVAQGLPAGPLSPATGPQVPPPQAAAPQTTAPAPIRPRRTGLIVGASLAVVAAAVAGTVLLTMGGPKTPETPSRAANAGRFATAPDPCTLLTGPQAKVAVPSASPLFMEATQNSEPSCSWDDLLGDSRTDRRLRIAVGHRAPTPGKSGPDTAHAFFVSERTSVVADQGNGLLGSTGPLRNIGRVGAEAFSYDVVALDRIHSVIRFRVSNLLVEVNLSEVGKRAGTALRRDTLKIARQVSEELNSRD
ncbi:serine/threonine-protein kinase [Streptosporangium amethystogenes]|uniref:serine/threonine-protein kinase n=1 Tax=Streptosporangium amethystogenes TaxID=2002 RepID=UPI00068C3A15|nr:serine/threonine-protein kinase [Streptosporangium amethystogenes]